MATINGCRYWLALLIPVLLIGATTQIAARGSKLFIAPMEGGLDGFIAAELFKKKIPMVVVTDENQADFILSGVSLKADDKWYNVVFGGKDKNEGNVRLLDVKTKQIVWAGEAGDRSLWMAGWRRGGERKIADRIIEEMKKQLFK
jgi:hypothetical protein